MAPLCVCLSCGRKIDCDPSGICEVCEANGIVAVMVCTPADTRVLIDTLENPPEPNQALKDAVVDWAIKCCAVGCRVYGAENLILWSNSLWCPKHFNNMQRQQCIDRGCRHKIPDAD
jgi:hypothetical protein